MRQGIVRNYEERAVEQRTQTVQAQLKIVADHLVNEDYLNSPSSKVISAELDMLSNLYDGRVLIINGNFKIIKDTYFIILYLVVGSLYIIMPIVSFVMEMNELDYLPEASGNFIKVYFYIQFLLYYLYGKFK